MKKIFLAIALFCSVFKASADEGMWLPTLLGEQVYNDMVKKGLKLTKEQLYSVNRSSIKDAIIMFGPGCTGEIVSNRGLIFTNHHCGYEEIAAASTVQNNYLTNGFYAKNLQEEIKTKLTVRFLLRIEDVTAQVEEGLKGLDGAGRAAKVASVYKGITDKVLDASKGIMGQVYSMFRGNQFLMYVYQVYRDIRLVGTPPESIGKFGGDTDNWEWPRHTGDFSIFRVYADKNGIPADYSPSNVPFKPKHFLPVSLKGVKDGDYAMIYGNPGSTNRYETSYGVKMKTDITNPTLVKLRDIRLKLMMEEMLKDAGTRLKLASNYANVANYWKFFDGETKQLLKFRTYEQKKETESKFVQWAAGKTEYENIFSNIASNYESWQPYEKHRMHITEGILGSPLLTLAASAAGVEGLWAGQKTPSAEDITKAVKGLDGRRKTYLEGANKESDENIVAAVVRMFYNEIDKAQHPAGLFDNIQTKFGPLTEEATFKKMAKDLFANTLLLNESRWAEFMNNPNLEALQNDPAYQLASAFVKNYNSRYAPMYQKFLSTNTEQARWYLKGIMQMNPEAAKKMYPDANLSMRVSYGTVKSYAPRDAVKYDFVCTSAGLLQKYQKDNYEFHLQDYIVDALKKKDFGQYADKTRKDLVVTFITDNDITGGNSGSPV
ncbi:MAG: S46 family peptidase, partial [Dinghuibacter sp.]|nr:S46 family peptidase [Dinghuibacter sp.]